MLPNSADLATLVAEGLVGTLKHHAIFQWVQLLGGALGVNQKDMKQLSNRDKKKLAKGYILNFGEKGAHDTCVYQKA